MGVNIVLYFIFCKAMHSIVSILLCDKTILSSEQLECRKMQSFHLLQNFPRHFYSHILLRTFEHSKLWNEFDVIALRYTVNKHHLSLSVCVCIRVRRTFATFCKMNASFLNFRLHHKLKTIQNFQRAAIFFLLILFLLTSFFALFIWIVCHTSGNLKAAFVKLQLLCVFIITFSAYLPNCTRFFVSICVCPSMASHWYNLF